MAVQSINHAQKITLLTWVLGVHKLLEDGVDLAVVNRAVRLAAEKTKLGPSNRPVAAR